MLSLIVSVTLCLFADFGHGGLLISQEDHRCDVIMAKATVEDRGMTSDDSPFKLHSIWLSQQCETRAGPEQANVIRKYSFFANGTFVLIRYHYADESCSIATYAIVARGFIEISSSSSSFIRISGATEANARLDSVHLIPYNRQVARQFRRRINAICASDDTVETKWRPYRAESIYERSIYGSSDANIDTHELHTNSFESRLRISRNRDTLDCLETLGIEFTELSLIRVEKRISGVELLLGETSPPNARHWKAFGTRTPNRLQSMALLRADTLVFCPICGNVLRATQYSPPLFHQAPTFPAEIGGLWLSIKCESVDKGFWARRVFRIYSGGGRWIARWTYYTDYACLIPSCTVMATGTYVRREWSQSWSSQNRLGESREKRQCRGRGHGQGARDHRLNSSLFLGHGGFRFKDFVKQSKESGKHSNLYFRIFRIFQMKPVAVSGVSWPKNCLPPRYAAFLEASVIPTFKARINLDWNGDYALLLASWKDNVWEAPLRRCSDTIFSINRRAKSCAADLKSRQKFLFVFNSSGKFPILFAFCIVSHLLPPIRIRVSIHTYIFAL
ncbi:protein APCDD1-like [Augochlora pura]